MIQRIQSIYLAIATVLAALLLKGPIVSLVGPIGDSYIINLKGLMLTSENASTLIEKSLPLSILLVIIPVLFFLSIFLFKRRKLQIRVTVLATLLFIGVLLLLIYYMLYAGRKLDADFIFNIKMTFPLVGSIFGYLAFRSILKDELLIKSYDRIR